MKRDYIEPTENASVAVWRELSAVCQRVHHHLYETRNKAAAGRYRARLQRMILELPENDRAILRQEALALLHELANDIPAALQYRTREIQLIERLHASVTEAIASGRYNKRMGGSILADWDKAALSRRRVILSDLRKKLAPAQESPQARPRRD